MEQYLARCLNSLLTQTLKEIEIIAINDGSTDSSQIIIEKLASKDKRIIVVNQQNQGVSAARNNGINIAQGDYIGFVDPDDWVDADAYSYMLHEALQEDADIVMCSYIREFGTHAKEKQFDIEERAVFASDEVKQRVLRRIIGPIDEELASPESLDAWGTVWNKIYRRNLIQHNNITFIDLQTIGSNEDSLFNIHAVYYANKFVFVNKPFYHYWRLSHQSQASHYRPRLLEQWLVLYQLIEQFLQEKQLPAHYYSALKNRVCIGTLGLGLNEVSKNNTATMTNKIRALKSILEHHTIFNSFQDFNLSYCPVMWRAFYLFAKSQFAIGFYTMLQAIEFLRKTKR